MLRRSLVRSYSSFNKPGPIPLGNKKHHQEMLDKIRKKSEADMKSEGSLHDDAIPQPTPDFEGDVNPKTGEVNGPKTEPTRHGDWSFGGRVTDF